MRLKELAEAFQTDTPNVFSICSADYGVALTEIAAKLGAMEAMIPGMYSGMWAGMFVGMLGSMMPVTAMHAAEIGAACGVAEIIFIWIANTILRGTSREGRENASA